MLPRVLATLLVVSATAGCGLGDASSGVRVAGHDASASVSDGAVDPDDGAVGQGRPGGALGVPGVVAGVPEPGSFTDDAGDERGATIEPPLSVAVVGDSLTLSAHDEIEAAFEAVGIEVVAIDGVENRRMTRGGSGLPPGTDAIDEIIEGGILPDVWVVALGTNDVGAQVSASTFADDVATVLRRIPPTDPVIWVDLWIRDRPDEVIEANDAIRAVLAVRPGSTVVNWHVYGGLPDTITGDGVHLTGVGQRLFAAAIAGAVTAHAAG